METVRLVHPAVVAGPGRENAPAATRRFRMQALSFGYVVPVPSGHITTPSSGQRATPFVNRASRLSLFFVGTKRYVALQPPLKAGVRPQAALI